MRRSPTHLSKIQILERIYTFRNLEYAYGGKCIQLGSKGYICEMILQEASKQYANGPKADFERPKTKYEYLLIL